ncbi:MAG: type II secretion system protein [Armatimonadota bacterium]|nr:type II secretion system protein [Armatimonadota bacterium]
MRNHTRWLTRLRGHEGFTLMEILVAMSLFAAFSLIVLQALMAALGQTGRANERAAATTLALQVMEQVRASANPYEMVNLGPLARSALPLPAPYDNVTNPTPYPLQVAVETAQDANLTLLTATIRVYRPTDPDAAPLVSLTTVLDDQ